MLGCSGVGALGCQDVRVLGWCWGVRVVVGCSGVKERVLGGGVVAC